MITLQWIKALTFLSRMCFGDGGTPVVVDNQVVAVNSWGIPCATGSPDVHTRVGPYRPWIRLVTGV
jgi:secreted trypsin-like serine protease